MNTRTILLVFGGESAEHEVSIRSAANVHQALDAQKYAIILCYIDRQGRWWRVDEVAEPVSPTTGLYPLLGEGALISADGTRHKPDVIVPVLHGPNGEDGSVQGLAQLLHIPIVGCGIVGSAVCMDKDVAKRLLRQAGIMVADGLTYRRGETRPRYDELRATLGDVLFVKPANMGSSVGVGRATNASEFETALDEALKHDRKVLIERAVVGRELECSVLGNDHPEASVVGEILPEETFYSYHAKYADDSQTKTSTHVEFAEGVEDAIRALAIKAYTELECRGLARVDFFLTDSGDIYVNEINTLPGFTSISMYPQLWQESGLAPSALLDRLVDLALE